MKLLSQSPLDDAFVQNPYALYARVQADDPVRYWEDYKMPAVFDGAMIQSLLRDRRLGRAVPDDLTKPVPNHLAAFDKVERHSMLDLEPPRHTRLRGLVLRAFTSRRIKALTPDILEICDDLLTNVPDEPFDLLPAYCTPLPVRIIARLLGVPEDMSPELLRWSNAMVAMYMAGRTTQTERAANAAAAEFHAFLTGYIQQRRSDPRDDLITHLIAAEENASKLTYDEMIGTCILLLNAGHEATVHTLGNTVKNLIDLQVPMTALNDENVANTVEEALRFDPPLHMFTRYAYEEIEIGGHTLAKGTEVALVLGAAGRDPKRVNDPARFDPFRETAPHATFGAGLHFCIGAPLARLEMQVGLQQLFATLPNLHIVQPPKYANTYHFHGLQQLMVHR